MGVRLQGRRRDLELRHGLTVTTWNAESLTTNDRSIRRRKSVLAESVLRDAHVLCLQEVRIEQVAIEGVSRRFNSNIAVFIAPGIR